MNLVIVYQVHEGQTESEYSDHKVCHPSWDTFESEKGQF